ncbi:glycosyltransferase [Dyadobacter sp. 3J3]|uniref:glycosyltransferase family 2 protein n=1 Tax=Dyadobacter sp. 3J3 TaxID=2606600 RepID=UPI00135A642B|nr:glycosyltransferase [Dyadobacter sp. 3J3]
MDDVLVTIGMPVFNGEDFIEMAVNSILNQTFKNFELIIADDGSTDSTYEILKSFNDDRIVIIKDGKNMKAPYRLNQMVSIARGKYFARMDADDVMFPDRIKIQVNEFENHNIDLLHGDAISINNNGNVLGYKFSKPAKSKKNILDGLVPMHPTVMAKTSVLRNNPYKGEYSPMEDLELWYRLIDNCIFKNMNTPVLFYREASTPNSLKHKKFIKHFERFADEHDLSFMSKQYLVLLSRIKYFTFRVLEMGNMAEILLKQRSSRMSDDDIKKYETILNLATNR